MTQNVEASFDIEDCDTLQAQDAQVRGFARVIGDERVVIRRALFKVPTTQNSNTLVLSASSQGFTAKAELERLLRHPPMYTQTQLETAQRAAERLASQVGDDDPGRLAERLSEDLVKLGD